MKRAMPTFLLLIAVLMLAATLVQLHRTESATAQQALTRAQGGYLRPADVDNPILLRGCVIRFDELSSTGKSVRPRILANSSHICVGITSVTVDWDRGDLVLADSRTNKPVVVAFAEEDETLSAKDIQCGPSGGTTNTRISCYREGKRVPVYSLQMYHRYANLWVGIQNWDGP